MRIETRTINEFLVIDLFEPFPEDTKEKAEFKDALCETLVKQDNFVIVFNGFKRIDSTFIGILLHCLVRAKVPCSGFGGPYVRVVCDNASIRDSMRVLDSPFQVYANVDEALHGSEKY